MAGERGFLPDQAHYPDANAAAYQVIKGSGSPASYFPVHLFDAATDESIFLVIESWPSDYTSSPALKIDYSMVSATTGSVRFEALMRATTPGDAHDVDGRAFASTNSAGDTVPGTAGYLDSLTITLTNNDSVAAGDYVEILVRRDADGTTGTDDATGDCEVRGYLLTWS